MKKLQLVAVIMALFVYGCSEQMSPVEPTETPGNALEAKKAGDIIPFEDSSAAARTIITVSKRILANDGGTVSLQGGFTGTNGKDVIYEASIVFPAGALPADTTISITIEKISFQENADVTFGPCGLFFNIPGELTLNATNVQIAEKSTEVRLLYWNHETWEPMPDSWGHFTKKHKGTVEAGASIPHFSRYAFGR